MHDEPVPPAYLRPERWTWASWWPVLATGAAIFVAFGVLWGVAAAYAGAAGWIAGHLIGLALSQPPRRMRSRWPKLTGGRRA